MSNNAPDMALSGCDSAIRSHHKFNMKTRNTKLMKCKRMVERRDWKRTEQGSAWRALCVACVRLAVAGTLAVGLGACASGASSSMFVDPSMYDLYNCQQLGTARKASNDRVVELERLMAKAESGAAGSLVSGLAYQTDYVSERARRDQIDEKIASNKCTSADLAAPTTPSTPQPPAPATKRRH